jgi:hypothetical protein
LLSKLTDLYTVQKSVENYISSLTYEEKFIKEKLTNKFALEEKRQKTKKFCCHNLNIYHVQKKSHTKSTQLKQQNKIVFKRKYWIHITSR